MLNIKNSCSTIVYSTLIEMCTCKSFGLCAVSQYKNKLMLQHLNTRCRKCYTLNTMHIRHHKISWIRNLTKHDPMKINNHTVQCYTTINSNTAV